MVVLCTFSPITAAFAVPAVDSSLDPSPDSSVAIDGDTDPGNGGDKHKHVKLICFITIKSGIISCVIR